MNIKGESLTIIIESSEFIVRTYDDVISELRPDDSWELMSLIKDLQAGTTTVVFIRYNRNGGVV